MAWNSHNTKSGSAHILYNVRKPGYMTKKHAFSASEGLPHKGKPSAFFINLIASSEKVQLEAQ